MVKLSMQVLERLESSYLEGGLPKHHICNANMMRNGADYAVFINTAQEFDGSDSGARPDEAVSWGKIRGSAKTVKVRLFVPPFYFCMHPFFPASAIISSCTICHTRISTTSFTASCYFSLCDRRFC